MHPVEVKPDPRLRLGMRGALLVVAILAIGLAGLVSFLRWLESPHIRVTIVNQTAAPIRDLRLTFLYGERTAPLLEPGGVALAEIQSGGEAGVYFSYRDSDGSLSKNQAVHYSESTASLDRGTLEVHITTEGIRTTRTIGSHELDDLVPFRKIRVNPTGLLIIR